MAAPPMMNAARYSSGLPFDDFVERATKYEELWRIGWKRAEVPAALVAELVNVRGPLHMVNLNEDWCFDAISTTPSIAKLAELLPAADLRVFGRDANPDLMDAHLSGPQGLSRAIPVVIVYDDHWRERGWWGSRPRPLQAWVETEGMRVPKEEKYRYIRQWYARDRAQTTLREVADLLLRCATEVAVERGEVAPPAR
jgi:hypothetical protein